MSRGGWGKYQIKHALKVGDRFRGGVIVYQANTREKLEKYLEGCWTDKWDYKIIEITRQFNYKKYPYYRLVRYKKGEQKQ